MHGFETCLIRIKDNKQPHTKFDKAAQNERTVYIGTTLEHIFHVYFADFVYKYSKSQIDTEVCITGIKIKCLKTFSKTDPTRMYKSHQFMYT